MWWFVGWAWAQHGSVPQAVHFTDVAPVLEGLAAGTGWWPAGDVPLAIRLRVTTRGGLETTLRGESELTWTDQVDEPVLQRVVAATAPGLLRLDGEIALGADVRIDVPGVFTGTVPLDAVTLEVVDEADLTTLLLPGGPTTAEVRSDVDPVRLRFPVDVAPGVALEVAIEVTPDLRAELDGLSVRTEASGVTRLQTAEGAWVELPRPAAAAEVGVSAAWNGRLTSTVDLVVSPELTLQTPAGDFDVARVDLPLRLDDRDELRTVSGGFAVHPLPLLTPAVEVLDFGDVGVGSVAVLDLPLENAGELLLAGEVVLDGGAAFAVSPGSVTALPRGEDGLVVWFAPQRAGVVQADVWLLTNDPGRPEQRVVLRGRGLDPDAAGAGQVQISTCGCSATGPTSPLGAGLGLLLWLSARRRRSGDAPR